MPGLSAWAVRRPIVALVAWVLALAAFAGLGLGLGGAYNDSFDLPDTESKVATDLLVANGTDLGNVDGGATIVWSPASGASTDQSTAEQVLPVLQEIASLEARRSSGPRHLVHQQTRARLSKYSRCCRRLRRWRV